MKYKALYRKKRENPFVPLHVPFDVEGTVEEGLSSTVEFPDDKSFSEIEQLAREATPKGYVFIRVSLVN